MKDKRLSMEKSFSKENIKTKKYFNSELKLKKRYKLKVKKEKTDNSSNFGKGRWTEDEQRSFLNACIRHGSNWKKVKFYIYLKIYFNS